MADKDFKVKLGIDLGTPLPILEGGTGQTTASNALNALLPVQTSNSGKFLSTDGTNPSWLDQNYGTVKNNGVAVNKRAALNIIGATITDDSVNNQTTITISAGGSTLSPLLFVGM